MGKNIRQASLYTIIGKLISKILGLIRERLTKTLFGLSAEMSIYSFIITLIGLIRSISIRSFTKTTIPYFLTNKKDKHITSSIYTVVVGLNLIIGIIIIIFSRTLARYTLGKLVYSDSLLVFGTYMYIMAGILLIVLSIADISEALMSSIRIFEYQIIREPFVNTLYILSLIALPSTFTLLGGRILGELMFMLAILSFILLKKPVLLATPKFQYIKNLLLITIPIILGTSINFINTFVDRYMATLLSDTRSVSALASATTLAILPYSLFGESISKSVYTGFSESASNKDFRLFSEYVGKVIYLGGWLIIPSSVGLATLSSNITYFLYFGGKFTMSDVNLVGTSLTFYSFRYLFTALYIPLNNALIALEKRYIPMWLAIIFIPINILLNWLLGFKLHMGAPGFALATAIVSISMFMATLILLTRIPQITVPKTYLLKTLKVIVASIIMATLLLTCKHYLPLGRTYTILLIMIGIMIHVTLLFLLKDEEMMKLITKLQRRINL